MGNQAWLAWYMDMGVDEAVADAPVNRLAAGPHPAPLVQTEGEGSGGEAAAHEPRVTNHEPRVPPSATVLPLAGTRQSLKEAEAAANAANTLEELKKALESFNGLSIRRTAQNTVFAEGNPKARVMVIGEAPGAEEDASGIPFCGRSGQLLDKMLASAGLTRAENCYITNMIFWRPPGNRKPSAEEVTLCLPFVKRHITLLNPAMILLAGGTAAAALLEVNQGITRLRGREFSYHDPASGRDVPCFPIFHPSYLLRQPSHKRLAWQDMLLIRRRLVTIL